MVIHFPIIHPSLVVFRKDISHRTDLEFFSMFPSLFLDISPKIGFTAEAPRSWKMIDFLVRVKTSQFTWSDQGSPNDVQTFRSLATVNQMEPCCLQSINDAIIGVGLTAYSKRKVRIRHQLILSEDLYFIRLERSLHLQKRRVVEEN